MPETGSAAPVDVPTAHVSEGRATGQTETASSAPLTLRLSIPEKYLGLGLFPRQYEIWFERDGADFRFVDMRPLASASARLDADVLQRLRPWLGSEEVRRRLEENGKAGGSRVSLTVLIHEGG